MTTWELEDVEAAAQARPRSFFIPSLDERMGQSVGDEVRLHFVLTQEGPDLPRAERMWVEIIAKTGSPPSYIGVLQNQPKFITGLDVGDRVTFGPKHIARTVIRRSDPRWFEAGEQQAVVSRMVFEEGNTVRWMYRESADRPDDSGWRLFAGGETEGYLDDPANARICDVGWLIEFDPTLLPAIRADVGAAFEHSSAEAPWIAVPDWKPAEEFAKPSNKRIQLTKPAQGMGASQLIRGVQPTRSGRRAR